MLTLSKPRLLIVGELGDLSLEPDAAHQSFHLVSRRDETGAKLITSNLNVAERGTVFSRLLHHGDVLTIRATATGSAPSGRAGLIKPPAGDGPPVGSASLRPVSGGANQPSTEIMNQKLGRSFMTQSRMAFDAASN